MHVKGLNRNQIKYIVIVAMLIDHIAWAFVPHGSALYIVMRFIGRLTGPTMAYFLAEGYLHTSNRLKYGIRLGVFALISWIPYSLFENSSWPQPDFPVIYTLFLGFIALCVWYNPKINYLIKVEIVIGIIILATWGDWSYMDIILPFFAVRFKDDDRMKWRAYTIMCVTWAAVGFVESVRQGLFSLGILMVPLLLKYGYNGEPGSGHPFHKWFFYIFYPLHLSILVLLLYNRVQVCNLMIDFGWK